MIAPTQIKDKTKQGGGEIERRRKKQEKNV